MRMCGMDKKNKGEKLAYKSEFAIEKIMSNEDHNMLAFI